MQTSLTLIVLLLLAAAAGCGDTVDPSPNPSQSADGHQRMLALLDDLRARAADEHLYLGDAELRKAERQLAALQKDGKPADRTLLLARVGAHELRLGQTEEAIEHLRAAYERLEKNDSPETDDSGITPFMAESIVMTLAVACLRQAENVNCVHCRTGESCILPIRGDGVHVRQSDSRNAIKYLEILLARNPDHLGARWLLNVAYMTVGEYPDKVPEQHLIPPAAFESEEEFPRFTNVAADVGLDRFSLCGGTAVDDFDGDGLLDVIVSDWNSTGQIRFFRNSGDGRFIDRTKQAGLIGILGGLNLVHADYDNDGDMDVLVLRGAWLGKAGRHPNSLLRNEGRGRFRDVTFDAGLGFAHFPTQTAAWADFDNDGDLDLYVGNEKFPCQLFQNDGAGRFSDVARRAGVTNDRYTKGVACGDFDGDGFTDIYVSNLKGTNRLYRNSGRGTFHDVAPRLGVTRPHHSFPVWFWDYDNDGALDLYVASYEAAAPQVAADYLGLPREDEPDCFYRGDGQGRFYEATRELGYTRATLPMGCSPGDLDNDGFPDFYLGTGDPSYENLVPNLLFHNQRGRGFADVTTAAGMGHLQKGHGVAFADFDHDGDQDVFIELGGAYPGDGFQNALFENPGFENHWIKLKLIGTRSNRCAIGARIRIDVEETGEERSIYKWVDCGSSFGGNPFRQEIGLGQAPEIKRLEIHWPASGQTQEFHDVAADQFIEVTEGEDEFRPLELKSVPFKKSRNARRVTASTP